MGFSDNERLSKSPAPFRGLRGSDSEEDKPKTEADADDEPVPVTPHRTRSDETSSKLRDRSTARERKSDSDVPSAMGPIRLSKSDQPQSSLQAKSPTHNEVSRPDEGLVKLSKISEGRASTSQDGEASTTFLPTPPKSNKKRRRDHSVDTERQVKKSRESPPVVDSPLSVERELKKGKKTYNTPLQQPNLLPTPNLTPDSGKKKKRWPMKEVIKSYTSKNFKLLRPPKVTRKPTNTSEKTSSPS
ncbi:hypothetical protein CC1G_08953 [Coprinopsis cinerea okayama7|uniref:Uncharacterized protein n=1 Tax=Coprinopsis cinerea (strain Okayama-7 / 130 / ATCC MYA-4618 / FGSC 9003) TaxID=240176 RepID=A8P4Q7_COPC7|nr:hypothetical protein CC1G_08953 [Coprinopsis cinerea okayama7\|eukprot:XP_001838789.2 hypothetical protein CC1G_08953 [Coprinopsis cinerea okayama7\